MEKKRQQKAIHSDKSSVQKHDAGDHAPIEIWFNIRGTNRRGDLDGRLSTTLDCLVSEKIIQDDRLTIVDRIHIVFERSETPGIDIVIVEEV